MEFMTDNSVALDLYKNETASSEAVLQSFYDMFKTMEIENISRSEYSGIVYYYEIRVSETLRYEISLERDWGFFELYTNLFMKIERHEFNEKCQFIQIKFDNGLIGFFRYWFLKKFIGRKHLVSHTHGEWYNKIINVLNDRITEGRRKNSIVRLEDRFKELKNVQVL